jgi:hypothetical protein
MRRNGTNNPREAKIIAKQKYAERQIDKWVKWIGFYPGFLVGIRSYEMEDGKIHVLYLPLVDLALTIYN